MREQQKREEMEAEIDQSTTEACSTPPAISLELFCFRRKLFNLEVNSYTCALASQLNPEQGNTHD
jgi:hypothetical protein